MYEYIDLASPDLGKRLLRQPNGRLPVSVWKRYVVHQWRLSHERTSWPPPSIFSYCDEPPKSTEIQKAVDDAYGILASLAFTSPKSSYEELAKKVWEAIGLLYQVHSSHRKRGHPKSMQHQAVRAYLIRKFNPDPNKSNESTVGWAQLADKLLNENGKCPRCRESRHQYDSLCVKALTTAERRLRAAMKHDGIPV